MLSLIPFHLNQPGTADLPAWYLTRAFCWLAEGNRRPANREGEFGQMEALPAMEMGACGQRGEDSAPSFPVDPQGEGLMAFRGPQGAWPAWH